MDAAQVDGKRGIGGVGLNVSSDASSQESSSSSRESEVAGRALAAGKGKESKIVLLPDPGEKSVSPADFRQKFLQKKKAWLKNHGGDVRGFTVPTGEPDRSRKLIVWDGDTELDITRYRLGELSRAKIQDRVSTAKEFAKQSGFSLEWAGLDQLPEDDPVAVLRAVGEATTKIAMAEIDDKGAGARLSSSTFSSTSSSSSAATSEEKRPDRDANEALVVEDQKPLEPAKASVVVEGQRQEELSKVRVFKFSLQEKSECIVPESSSSSTAKLGGSSSGLSRKDDAGSESSSTATTDSSESEASSSTSRPPVVHVKIQGAREDDCSAERKVSRLRGPLGWTLGAAAAVLVVLAAVGTMVGLRVKKVF